MLRYKYTFVWLRHTLAACTKARFAAGEALRAEAARHALHSADVCFAITVAADSTCRRHPNVYIVRCSRRRSIHKLSF